MKIFYINYYFFKGAQDLKNSLQFYPKSLGQVLPYHTVSASGLIEEEVYIEDEEIFFSAWKMPYIWLRERVIFWILWVSFSYMKKYVFKKYTRNLKTSFITNSHFTILESNFYFFGNFLFEISFLQQRIADKAFLYGLGST